MLTMPAVLLGLVLMTCRQGAGGLVLSLAGIGLALALWILTALVGGSLGGGDIKLLGAVGALTGPTFLLQVLMLGAFAGGVWALSAAIHKRILLASLRRLSMGMWCAAVTRMPEQLAPSSEGLHIPYAPAIAIGTILTSLWVTIG